MIILGFCLPIFFHVLVGLSTQFVPDEFRAHGEQTTRNPAQRARFVGRAGVSSASARPIWQALTS